MNHIGQYIEYQKGLGYAPRTVGRNENDLREFKAWAKKREDREINAEDIRRYKEHLQKRSISLNTVCIKLRCLERYFNDLIKRRYLLMNPMDDVEKPNMVRHVPKDILSRAEVESLLEAPGKDTLGVRNKSVLELLYSTGIRVSELKQLNLTDLNMRDREIHIQEIKQKRQRVVPLGIKAVESMKHYLLTSRKKMLKGMINQAVFLSLRGNRIETEAISRMLRKYTRRLGIDKRITPHCLRHSCATHMLQNGAPVEIVQRQLGHASSGSTAIYTRIEPDNLKEVMEQCHPWHKGKKE